VGDPRQPFSAADGLRDPLSALRGKPGARRDAGPAPGRLEGRLILAMQEEPGMFDFYRNFQSFLNVHRYASQEQLIADLGEKVIRPAELKVLDLQGST
jgi:hypothetical protein